MTKYIFHGNLQCVIHTFSADWKYLGITDLEYMSLKTVAIMKNTNTALKPPSNLGDCKVCSAILKLWRLQNLYTLFRSGILVLISKLYNYMQNIYMTVNKNSNLKPMFPFVEDFRKHYFAISLDFKDLFILLTYSWSFDNFWHSSHILPLISSTVPLPLTTDDQAG
jgi:hypothetical protein